MILIVHFFTDNVLLKKHFTTKEVDIYKLGMVEAIILKSILK